MSNNKKNVNLQAVWGYEVDLIASNLVYLAGQPIYVIDQYGNIGHKAGMWDDELDPLNLNGAPDFVNLPWISPPASFGASKMNIWMVLDSDPSYAVVGNDIVVTDVRLKGKQHFPIMATQSGGGAISPDIITYDTVNGKVTLAGFTLDPGAALFFVVPTGIGTDPDYIALNARVSAIEARYNNFLKPFLPTGLLPALVPSAGKVWYVGDISLLAGTGWEIYHDHDGLLPMPILAGDADFDKPPGTTIGSKFLKIISTGMLPKFRLFTMKDFVESKPDHPSEFGQKVSALRAAIITFYKQLGGGNYGVETYEVCGARKTVDDAIAPDEPNVAPTSAIGKDDPDPIKHIPGSITGHWIHFKG